MGSVLVPGSPEDKLTKIIARLEGHMAAMQAWHEDSWAEIRAAVAELIGVAAKNLHKEMTSLANFEYYNYISKEWERTNRYATLERCLAGQNREVLLLRRHVLDEDELLR
jgi:hypothetical protein